MRKIVIILGSEAAANEELAKLLENCGYGAAAEYLSIPSFSSSFFCPGTVCAMALLQGEGKIIGFARAFTDDITTTYLAEICVHRDFSGNGLESQLVKAIVKRCSHTAIFTTAFEGELKSLAENSIIPKDKIIACSRRPVLERVPRH